MSAWASLPRAMCPSGMRTAQVSPARALKAAADAEVLPVEAHTTALAPSSTALEMAMVMPRSLNEPVGLAPSILSRTRAPDPGRQPGRLEQRRAALEQGHHRGVRRDREELPVLLDDPAPAEGPAAAWSADVTTHPRSASRRRSAPPRPDRSSAASVARTSPSRARWVTKTRRASPDAPSCSTERIDTPLVAERRRDRTEHAGPVGHVEADVEAGLEIGLGHQVRRLAVGRRGGGAGQQVPGGVDQIAHHRAGRGQPAGALAVEHQLAGRLAFDEHRVERVPHAGQRVGGRHQGRVDPDRQPVVARALDDGEQLDHVPGPSGEVDVGRR